MIVDRKWAIRNLGVDPLGPEMPETTLAHPSGRGSTTAMDLEREIIDFDSESEYGTTFLSLTKGTGLTRFVELEWPAGLAPSPLPALSTGSSDPLPRADVLIVTWTMDEGHALSRVLTPGKDSRTDYLPYTHNYAAISADMRAGCPALELKRLGAYWMTKIGSKSVLVFKSDSHMSQDGPKLPNVTVWSQIIEEVRPKLVITTGTAGGIGKQFEVGDVVVSSVVRFDCTAKFKSEPFAKAAFSSAPVERVRFEEASQLFAANASQLPPDNTRPPKIFVAQPGELTAGVVTTDFFGFDTDDNHYMLQGLGHVCEMGDAILGMVAAKMGESAPAWVAVRNVSDPEIKVGDMTIQQQGQFASHIYKVFGRWSSVCSAIVCWALVTSA